MWSMHTGQASSFNSFQSPSGSSAAASPAVFVGREKNEKEKETEYVACGVRIPQRFTLDAHVGGGSHRKNVLRKSKSAEHELHELLTVEYEDVVLARLCAVVTQDVERMIAAGNEVLNLEDAKAAIGACGTGQKRKQKRKRQSGGEGNDHEGGGEGSVARRTQEMQHHKKPKFIPSSPAPPPFPYPALPLPPP